MKQSFEQFLMDKCHTHTNNSPEGFEKWEEQLDVQELEDFAQDYGLKCFIEGQLSGMDRAIQIIKK